MHPAYSVIFFTTASGAGYGLMFWLMLGHALDRHPVQGWLFLTALTLALLLVTAGLLSSTFHLGRPERAWRAFSQWRSSWLSREGVVAVATYVPAGLLWLLAAVGIETGWSRFLAVLAALGAIGTVHCTGMIYASLKTIRQWHLSLVPALYHVLALASGALLLTLLLASFGQDARLTAALALIGLLAGLMLKLRYWQVIDGNPGQYTAAMAILPGARSIRPLDPPHTRPNFVMREMGYAVARKHADKLRRMVLMMLFALPALLMGIALAWPEALPLASVAAVLATGFGVVTERWLFFAEASHVSMLYYGLDRA